ncbi:hypothetical protein C8J56DRAFT_973050 [Mycena floridula]|nr:hypothetical protein C8J56DRAFT_973050 [Mycena floridula]
MFCLLSLYLQLINFFSSLGPQSAVSGCPISIQPSQSASPPDSPARHGRLILKIPIGLNQKVDRLFHSWPFCQLQYWWLTIQHNKRQWTWGLG